MPLSVKEKTEGKVIRGFYDYNMLSVVIILVCFGLVMLYSASAYDAASTFGDDMHYLIRQGVISAASIVLALLISKMDYHFFLKLSTLLYITSILLMAMVKYTSLGIEYNGARRWLNIQGVQFQPSEIAKIAVILFLTMQIIKMGRAFYKLKGVLHILLYGFIPAFCAYYFTENLSTAVIIMALSFVLVFVAHPKTKPFILFAVVMTILMLIGIYIIANYANMGNGFRIRRVLAWLNPEEYSEYGGYQVLQGLYAIGSGGFFGKGLGNSTQKISTIPEAQNDMIFAIICEELGLFGAIILLILFGYLLYRLLWTAQNAPDLQGCLIASGVFIHIALQVILNICVVLNVIPTTGVTLPFVSYGGTSVLFLMVEVGMALSVSGHIELRIAPKEKAEASDASYRSMVKRKRKGKKVIIDKSYSRK